MKKIVYENLIDSKTGKPLELFVNSSLEHDEKVKLYAQQCATNHITFDWYFINDYELPS